MMVMTSFLLKAFDEKAINFSFVRIEQFNSVRIVSFLVIQKAEENVIQPQALVNTEHISVSCSLFTIYAYDLMKLYVCSNTVCGIELWALNK